MNRQTEKKQKSEILKKTTAMNLWLRAMIGAFLVYMACSVGMDLENTSGKDTWILGGAALLFVVAGAVIVCCSLYRLIKKDYYDPLMEDDSESEPVEEKEDKF